MKECKNGVCYILSPSEEQEVKEELYKEKPEEADKLVQDFFRKAAENLE